MIEFKFEVGESYFDRRGDFTVMSLQNNQITYQYTDGEIRTVDLASKISICRSILAEKAVEEAKAKKLIRGEDITAYMYPYNKEVHSGVFSPSSHPDLIENLDNHCINFGYMKFGCNPSYEDKAVKYLTELGYSDLAGYLQVGKSEEENNGKESHGIWMNIFIPDPKIPDVDKLLHIYFNPRTLHSNGLYQLSKISYVSRLLGKVVVKDKGDI